MMGLWQRGACRVASRLCTRRLCSSPPPAPPPRPTPRQLWRLALASGVPFVGFGIADNGIMIIAGDQIDATLGVRLGISTLAAAGLGNMLSDVCGVGLGESIEAFCIRAGLHAPALTREQCQLRVTRFTKIGACGFGVALGCLIGMAPLLFISNRKQVTRRPERHRLRFFFRSPLFSAVSPRGPVSVCTARTKARESDAVRRGGALLTTRDPFAPHKSSAPRAPFAARPASIASCVPHTTAPPPPHAASSTFLLTRTHILAPPTHPPEPVA